MIKLFAMASKTLLASSGYKLKRVFKKPVKPLFINFPVTYRCNAKCVMCDIWNKYDGSNGQASRPLQEELTVFDIQTFVRKNKDFFSDLKSMGFTGGEAFLRKDIVDILKVIHEELPLVDVGVQTNGLLPEKIKEKIKAILSFNPNFKIAVSLDGIGADHDRVRGIDGAYEKALQTISYAKELGITGITCGMTLVPQNYDVILQVAQKVQEMGCEFSCFLPEVSEYFGNEQNKTTLSKEQLRIVSEKLKQFSYHYFMDNLRLQILGKRDRVLPCYSGYTSYVIDPYGDIHPCILRSESFGNVKDGQLKDVLFSKEAWTLRKKIESCTCWCECEVSSSAIIAPLDVLKWFLTKENKKDIVTALNKKILINRL